MQSVNNNNNNNNNRVEFANSKASSCIQQLDDGEELLMDEILVWDSKITGQYADLKRRLKRKLEAISADDWESLLKSECFEQEHVTALSLNPSDRLSDSFSGLSVVDPNPATDDDVKKSMSDAEISDLNARLKLLSVTRRLKEGVGGKIHVARQILQKGCPPTDEEAKAVVDRGLKANPKSVQLWLQAAKMEQDDDDDYNNNKRRRVLLKGLENIPDSVMLWKAVVEISNEDEARILLHKAVECCPLHIQLWLALATLETYDKAMKILSKARIKLPKEPAIWITTAKLVEAKEGDIARAENIIERGIRSLQGEGVEIDRVAWMKEAEAAERENSVATCKVIIRRTIGIGVEEEGRERAWFADAAEECTKRGSFETARAIYSHAISVFLTEKSVWIKAAQFEKSHGTRGSLESMLRRAVFYVPQAETLWLMGAKEKQLAGDVPAARAVLEEAYAANPYSEDILLAAFELEFDNHELERAKTLLAKARERGGGSTERVWMKSAVLEREMGNTDEERKLLDEGLRRFPRFYKLWLMLGQLEERLGGGVNNYQKAKEVYESGIKHCRPKCSLLWLSLADLEEKTNGLSKARPVLTLSRKENPQNPQLWLAAIRAELRHGNTREADSLISEALHECPDGSILWAHVIASVAKLFWQDGKVDSSRTWFNRAVTLSPDIGDFWALYYQMELQHGTEESQKDVLKRCVAAEPEHGDKWQPIAKAPENAHHPVEAILNKVVAALGIGKEDNAPGRM